MRTWRGQQGVWPTAGAQARLLTAHRASDAVHRHTRGHLEPTPGGTGAAKIWVLSGSMGSLELMSQSALLALEEKDFS